MIIDAESLAPMIKKAISEALVSSAAEAVYAQARLEMMNAAARISESSGVVKLVIDGMLADPRLARTLDDVPRDMTERLLARDDFVRLIAERVSAQIRASLT